MSTENKETESTSEAPIQAGALTQLLSQYRTDARLGHEQVSEALCLPVSSVKALENEEFDKLPEPPYVRGYLRTYSRLADKDATEAIKIYDKLHGGKPSTTASYHYSLNKKSGEVKPPLLSESSIRLGVLALLLGIVGLITMQPTINQWMKDTWASFSSEQSTQGNKLPGENLIDVNALTGNIPGNLPISNKPETTNTTNDIENNQNLDTTTASVQPENMDATATSSSTQLENTDTTDTTPATQEVSESTTENKPEDETNNTNTETTPPTVGDIKLKLVFANEAWIRIQGKDKKTVFEALNPANSEKELTLSPPVKFRIGSANGVKVYVNGEEKDISEYIKGSVANFSIE